MAFLLWIPIILFIPLYTSAGNLDGSVGINAIKSVHNDYDHPFYSNLNQNFSWEDPELLAALWKGIKSPPVPKFGAHKQTWLQKRVPPISESTCLSCSSTAAPIDASVTPAEARAFLADFTDALLDEVREDLPYGADCVFYTQRNPPGSGLPYSLSKTAANYARANNMYTVWVSIAFVLTLNKRAYEFSFDSFNH
jgi:hypothetical protein